jgi:signal transduction histidine kinase
VIWRLGLQARLALVGLPATLGLATAGALAAAGQGDALDSVGFAIAAAALAALGLVALVTVGRRTDAALDQVAHDAGSLGPDALLDALEDVVTPGRHHRPHTGPRHRLSGRHAAGRRAATLDYGDVERDRRDRGGRRGERDHDDELADGVAAPLARALGSVERAAIAAALRHGEAVREEMGDAVLRLAHRNQLLLDRQLALLDEFEDTELDPDGLDRLFRLDHLATQMRRRNDGMMVLSGADAADPDEQPVAVLDVLRGAVSAVEPFTRVTIQSTAVVSLAGALASDVALLLAELVDNATQASHTDTRVQLAATMTATGLAIHVIDHGPGLTAGELRDIEQLFTSGPRDRGAARGRGTGLVVVARLAARHGLRVLFGSLSPQGTKVTLEIPAALVGGGPSPAATGDEGAVPIVLAQLRRHDRLTARRATAGASPRGALDNGMSGDTASPFVAWTPRAARTPVPAASAPPREPTRFQPITVPSPPPAALATPETRGNRFHPVEAEAMDFSSGSHDLAPGAVKPIASGQQPDLGHRVAGEPALFRLADTGEATPSTLLGAADPVAAGGLVRRVPGATLRGDSVGAPSATRPPDARPEAPTRDPEEVRARMAAYRRGVALGRSEEAPLDNPPPSERPHHPNRGA